MHLDVIKRFTLAEIIVIGSCEQSRSVTAYDRLKITIVNVESHCFKSVHFSSSFNILPRFDYRSDDNWGYSVESSTSSENPNNYSVRKRGTLGCILEGERDSARNIDDCGAKRET